MILEKIIVIILCVLGIFICIFSLLCIIAYERLLYLQKKFRDKNENMEDLTIEKGD